MLKRVHKQTALSLHKNTTKLTSIDTQVQISEYIGGLNLPSNAVCYAEIRVWHPLRGQESRCKFQTTHFHWPSNFTPCSIEFLPHSDGRKRNLAISEIFRIFNMAFVETSKAGCAFSLKIGIHMDEQGMLQGTRNKTGSSQPLLSEGMVSSKVGPLFNACGISQRSNLRCHLLFLWVNTQTTGVANPRLTLPWTATSCGSTQRKKLDSSQCSSGPEPSTRLPSSKTFFSRSLSMALLSMKTHGFSSISCPRWTHSIGLSVSVTTHW